MAGTSSVRALGLPLKMLQTAAMTTLKPAFPAPDHDHGRCTADALTHAERVESWKEFMDGLRRDLIHSPT